MHSFRWLVNLEFLKLIKTPMILITVAFVIVVAITSLLVVKSLKKSEDIDNS